MLDARVAGLERCDERKPAEREFDQRAGETAAQPWTKDTRAHVMEAVEEDEDIKLARASAGLLADLESCLPKVLWKPSRDNHAAAHGPVHSRVRQKDLDYIINLVGSYRKSL